MTRLLLIITSDPRNNARPAEAIRIAAGVGVWKGAEITLYLRGAAVIMLAESTEDLADPENYALYLPTLKDCNQRICVQKSTAFLEKLGVPTLAFEQIDDEHLASLAASSNCVLRF